VVGLYEGAEATNGEPGVVALANMLMKMPQLAVNGNTLSNPTTSQLAQLASLVIYADGARSRIPPAQAALLGHRFPTKHAALRLALRSVDAALQQRASSASSASRSLPDD
jgi:hypothetical protein